MLDGLSKGKKLALARELFEKARDADRSFQKEAAEDFAFRDGEQWTEEEKAALAEECRPSLVMNVCKSSIDLIMGINDDTRVRFRASPVDPTDGFLCEVVNKIGNWVERNYSIDEEEDDAAECSAICGRGYVAVDFEADPKNLGHIRLVNESVPVHEVRLDPTSRRKDEADAQYKFRHKWINKSDFIVRYPKLKSKVDDLMNQDNLLPVDWLERQDSGVFDPDSSVDDSDYDREFDPDVFYDRAEDMLRIVHMEYWQPYFRYWAFNPATKKNEEITEKEIKSLKKLYPLKFGRPFEYVKIMDKKVKWLQFVGGQILYDGDSPIPYDGFSIVPCYAYSDMSKRTRKHFGVIRLMKDPQKEINKRWSQTLHMLNNQVQPGSVAEESAFLDIRQAEDALKTPGGMAIAQDGAIAGKKFMFRDVPNFPNAPMQMEQFSEVILRKITGINPDLLGQDRGRQEPGVVIRLRQQQGLTLLKPLFNSIRSMRQGTFERRVAIILKYMPDEQILQILGQNGRYRIQNGMILDTKTKRIAPIRNLRNLRYDIESEEAPGNKSQRILELSIYIEMMQGGMDVDPRVIINKLDLPDEEKQAWIQYISQKRKFMMEQAQREFQLKQMEVQGKIQGEVQKTQTDAKIKTAKVITQQEKDKSKLKLDYDKLALDDTKNLRDIKVRNRQVDAQFYAANVQRDNASRNRQGNNRPSGA